ncbi:MAG TPA: hypothetical protein VIA45_16485 [Thermoanaerobaculia bacterium]|jgi:hypothetical protein
MTVPAGLRALFVAAVAVQAAASPAPPAASGAAPTFCAEWVEQSREGYERLTLFEDRTLVWKRQRAGGEQMKKQRLTPEEAKFYCDYLRGDDIWSSPEDLRSQIVGDLVKESVVTIARPDGSRREIRFDEFSAMTPESAALRSSLDGLRGIFTAPLAPATRFTAENLPAGTILKRFDGVLFRVRRVDAIKGVAELEGVNEPYSEFRKIEDLRFLFAPPERP